MTTIGHLVRLWNTVKWLKPIQLSTRLRRSVFKPSFRSGPSPSIRGSGGGWVQCERNPTMTGPRRFLFLNQERTIDTAADWNHSEWPKLWLYNVHYHDDLNADGAEHRLDEHRKLLLDWMQENSPTSGNGWEAYPTSLRIVNWVKWLIRNPNESATFKQSLADKARWLSVNIEYHILGNHLWANGKSLVFAGIYFDGAEADRWLQLGCRILSGQLDEQILADGGHFERSPMYHGIILEDVLDLIQLNTVYGKVLPATLVDRLQAAIPKMIDWLSFMTHSDGQIAFFNDSTKGIAPSLGSLLSYAHHIGLSHDAPMVGSLHHLEASGFVRASVSDSVVLADVGSVGPSYIPGHAHAGTLSFEWSLGGSRVFVNSGVSTYDRNSERERQRGTSAHNTVMVNGVDSSETWASFRVARRASAEVISAKTDGSTVVFEAKHDGYMRLRPPVGHRREWKIDESYLGITDNLQGKFHHAVARFHVGPDWKAIEEPGGVSLCSQDGECLHVQVKGGDVRVEKSTWHPGFGLSVPIDVVCVVFQEATVVTEFKRDSTQ